MTPRNVRLIILAIILPACSKAPQESPAIADKGAGNVSVDANQAHAESHQTACYPYSLPDEVTSIVWVQLLQGKRVELKREIVEPILRGTLIDDNIVRVRSKGHILGELLVKGADTEVKYFFFKSPVKSLYWQSFFFRLDSNDFRRLVIHISDSGGDIPRSYSEVSDNVSEENP